MNELFCERSRRQPRSSSGTQTRCNCMRLDGDIELGMENVFGHDPRSGVAPDCRHLLRSAGARSPTKLVDSGAISQPRGSASAPVGASPRLQTQSNELPAWGYDDASRERPRRVAPPASPDNKAVAEPDLDVTDSVQGGREIGGPPLVRRRVVDQVGRQ